MSHRVFLTVWACLAAGLLFAQAPADPARARDRWVDSVFQTLNRDEKIGQLFSLNISSHAPAAEIERITELAEAYGPGSIVITGGGPVSHIHLLRKLQGKAKVPMLVGMRAEWGISQTMDSALGFQKPMVAATWTDELRDEWATGIARQLRELGVHFSLGPNFDNHIHPDDYLRYFGDDASSVTAKAAAFARALKREGILSVAALQAERADSTLLEPWIPLIQTPVDGILPARLPAPLPGTFAANFLRKKLEYRGLLFADMENIHRHSAEKGKGDLELLSFLGGQEIILGSTHIKESIRKISKRVKKDKLLQAQLDESIRRILSAKYDAGLSTKRIPSGDNLFRRLRSPESIALLHRLAEASTTVIRNEQAVLPIQQLEDKTFECISIGGGAENEFVHYLRKYVPVIAHGVTQISDTVVTALTPGSTVFVALFRQRETNPQIITWVKQLKARHQLVLVSFSNPQLLDQFQELPTVVAGYTEQDLLPAKAAQVLFGGLEATAVLPVKLEGYVPSTTPTLHRLSYSVPESAGLDSRTLEKISPILQEAIASGATPGGHVLVARKGKVILEQSAGWLSYENQQAVSEETLYDLASLTKVSATLQTVMFMYDHGMIDLEKKASVYLPELRESNKRDFTLKDVLTHQAGLWPFLPFWAQTMKDSTHMPEFYSYSYSADYPFPVSEDLFASRTMKDSLWKWIVNARIREKPSRTPYDYRYSDMGFYILQHLAERLLNQPMEDFLSQNLYEPLGAYTTGYLPLRRFSPERIAPTENDKLFRKSQLTGYVHDQGAAMHGGIAGHAGLFSTANDLAKLGQLWLQKGMYGGSRYYKESTIDLFATQQYDNSRRGIGWDKPPLGDWSGPTTLYASRETFGHTGFTGTCIWVDPAFDLVFIFLSNRVYPDMNNNKLLNTSIRPRVQEVVYRAIFDYCATHP